MGHFLHVEHPTNGSVFEYHIYGYLTPPRFGGIHSEREWITRNSTTSRVLIGNL